MPEKAQISEMIHRNGPQAFSLLLFQYESGGRSV